MLAAPVSSSPFCDVTEVLPLPVVSSVTCSWRFKDLEDVGGLFGSCLDLACDFCLGDKSFSLGRSVKRFEMTFF